MKKIITGMTLSLFLGFLSPKIYAQEKFSPSVIQDSSQLRLQVKFENPNNEKITVLFHSNDGNYWIETIKQPFFQKTYDLSRLEDGEHFLEITRGKEVFRKKINLYTRTVTTRFQSLL